MAATNPDVDIALGYILQRMADGADPWTIPPNVLVVIKDELRQKVLDTFSEAGNEDYWDKNGERALFMAKFVGALAAFFASETGSNQQVSLQEALMAMAVVRIWCTKKGRGPLCENFPLFIGPVSATKPLKTFLIETLRQLPRRKTQSTRRTSTRARPK